MEYKTREEVPNEFRWDLSKMYENESEIEKIEEVHSVLSSGDRKTEGSNES